jgi:hypothetical protein
MTAKSKGGRFTNSAIGTGGADTRIEPLLHPSGEDGFWQTGQFSAAALRQLD